ncbi:hypothetical protein MC885_004530 [Smutsia gigantea]|nr:hypothetical protein MC885_004530 [Smutsia gigantea]
MPEGWEDRQGCSPLPPGPTVSPGLSQCCHPAVPGSPSVPVLQAVCGEKRVSGELGRLHAGESGGVLSTLTRPREALHGVAYTPWRPGEAWGHVSLSTCMHVDQACGTWLTCACGGTDTLS